MYEANARERLKVRKRDDRHKIHSSRRIKKAIKKIGVGAVKKTIEINTANEMIPIMKR